MEKEELAEKIKDFFVDETADWDWVSTHGDEVAFDGKFSAIALAEYLLKALCAKK